MKFLLFFCFLGASLFVCHGQGLSVCHGSLSAYLACIKRDLDFNYGTFEQEFLDDSKDLIRDCFYQLDDFSEPVGNPHRYCYFNNSLFDVDAFGPGGPLGACSLCIEVATFIKNIFIDSTQSEEVCVRQVVRDAIGDELEPCIAAKLAAQGIFNFQVPDLPDFDQSAHPYKRKLLDTTGVHILRNSKLDLCSRFQTFFKKSTNCLDKPPRGYLTEHCNTLERCSNDIKSNFPNKCASELKKAQKATCECVEQKRVELQDRVSNIRDVVADVLVQGGTSTDCVNSIVLEIKSPEVDWIEVVDELLKCRTPRNAKERLLLLGMKRMLQLGCSEAVRMRLNAPPPSLEIGFNFVKNLIDAMIRRVSRFCSGNHCNGN